MSDATTKLGEGQKRGAIIAVALLAVGALGIAIGRCSTGAPTETAASSRPATQTTSAPVDAAIAFQVWDTVEDPSWKAGVSQRDMDRDIFARLKDPNLQREQLTDLFPDKPYLVRVVGSAYEHRYGLVMIDLDRDGKWDEKWDLMKPGEVHRVVEHDSANGGQRVEYTLVRGKWQPH